MADREPTVIERMQDAWTSHDGTPEECMLAAVRELHAIAVSPGVCQATLWTQNWLSDRILEHERRSEGKGE